MDAKAQSPIAAVGRAGVRAIDLVLLRYYGIFTFSDDPKCILRLSRGACHEAFVLKDGTHIAAGDPVLEVHLWNEQMPPLPAEGGTLMWGLAVTRRLHRSLRELAEFLARERELQSFCVLHGEAGFFQVDEFPQLRAFVEPLGFDFRAGQAPGWRIWKPEFWENLYSWWLMWTFSPGSLRGKHFSRMARCDFWISRATLIERHARPPEPARLQAASARPA